MAYSVPAPYATAIRNGLAVWYSADASYNGAAVAGATGLQPVGGSVSDTTQPGVRRVLNMQLAPTSGLFTALAPIGTTLSVYAHVRYADRSTAVIPMGVFDIDQETLTEGGGVLSVTAPDKWQRIVRAKFAQPVSSTSGMSVVNQIKALIQGALGTGETVNITATSTATVTTQTWDHDRDQAIIELANGIGAWVHFDRSGTATIADLPTTVGGANWTIDSGASGVLVSLDRTRSRTDAANLVVVDSTASGGAAFPTQFVWDTDSSSSTFVAAGPWGTTPPTSTTNPFGIVTSYFSTPLPLDAAGAIKAGAAQLYKTTGVASSVQLNTLHNPAIDAFDAISVVPPASGGGATELHLVDTVTHPLDITQAVSISGRSVRTTAFS